jgi:hypothetical protein
MVHLERIIQTRHGYRQRLKLNNFWKVEDEWIRQ